jgi:hypothetical protein
VQQSARRPSIAVEETSRPSYCFSPRSLHQFFPPLPSDFLHHAPRKMERATQQRPSNGLSHSSQAQDVKLHIFFLSFSHSFYCLSQYHLPLPGISFISLISRMAVDGKLQSSTIRPKIILITGVGSAKGLHMARAVYEMGHRVIGANFEPLRIPTCGRLSTALSAYHLLRLPTAGDSTA